MSGIQWGLPKTENKIFDLWKAFADRIVLFISKFLPIFVKIFRKVSQNLQETPVIFDQRNFTLLFLFLQNCRTYF